MRCGIRHTGKFEEERIVYKLDNHQPTKIQNIRNGRSLMHPTAKVPQTNSQTAKIKSQQLAAQTKPNSTVSIYYPHTFMPVNIMQPNIIVQKILNLKFLENPPERIHPP
jgi:hypothetical protein